MVQRSIGATQHQSALAGAQTCQRQAGRRTEPVLMYILGISCFYHDSAAALIKDGQLVAAAMEERFTRKKNDNGFPALAIDFCLRMAGITGRDLDYAVFYEKPL